MKNLAQWMGSPVVAMLTILLSCLFIFAGFFWHHDDTSQQHQRVTKQHQQFIADIVHSAVEAKIAAYTEQMVLAASDQLAEIIKGQNPALIAKQQIALKQLFPGINQVCLFNVGVDEPNPNACTPISFAALNNLRLAKKFGTAPMAVIHSAEGDKYLLLAQSVKDSQDKVVGVLVVTLPVEVMATLLQPSYSAGGYIELQQGDDTAAAFASQGDAQWREGRAFWAEPVAKSHFRLAYWPAATEKLRSYLVALSIVLSLVLLTWLFRERSRQLALSYDLNILQGQLIDLEHSQLRASYPTVTPEMSIIVSEINRLGIILPVRRKTKAPTSYEEADNKLKYLDTKAPISVSVDIAQPAALSIDLEDVPVEISATIFKAYDIRGIVGKTLDQHVVKTIGKAIGSLALELGQSRFVIGRDGRLSSASLSDALIDGIMSVGCDVVDIGEVPTPLVYFAGEHLSISSGVMVTGSHNPADYNGLKISVAGKPLFGDRLQQLYQRVKQADFPSGQGQIHHADVIDDYIAKVSADINLTKSLKVIVDCGNGVGGVVVPKLLSALGCEVIELYCDIDGTFPNHHPNPSDPANLQDLILAVQRSGADLGIAFDGDGDRLGTVDAKGNIIWSDRLMIMFAQDILSRLPGSLVIYDVKSTSLLGEAITAAGGEALMWQSGYAVIRDKMLTMGAPLAGELSGHIFFKDRWYGFDDAIYCACRLIELLAQDPLQRSSTEIFAAIPNRENTPEIMIDMDALECEAFIEKFVAKARFEGAKISTIDGLRADFTSGWGLVRASNTVPGLTLRFEADTITELQAIQQQFKQQMLQVDPTIKLLF